MGLPDERADRLTVLQICPPCYALAQVTFAGLAAVQEAYSLSFCLPQGPCYAGAALVPEHLLACCPLLLLFCRILFTPCKRAGQLTIMAHEEVGKVQTGPEVLLL